MKLRNLRRNEQRNTHKDWKRKIETEQSKAGFDVFKRNEEESKQNWNENKEKNSLKGSET